MLSLNVELSILLGFFFLSFKMLNSDIRGLFYDYGKYRYNIFGLSNKKHHTSNHAVCNKHPVRHNALSIVHFLGAWGSSKYYVFTSGVVLQNLSKCKFMQL